jgi:hypothetical protein
MGVECSPTSPCLFKGVLIEGQPPIYIGLYVDDIIYFSVSDEVEKFFETRLTKKIGTVNFMGQVSQFLGIEFHWVKHSDDNLSVTLMQQSFSESLIKKLRKIVFIIFVFLTAIPCSVILTARSAAQWRNAAVSFSFLPHLRCTWYC